MLNWLPGMNQCGFSEEETTKALYALYQLRPPDCNQDSCAQSRQDYNLRNLHKVGKKKEHDSGRRGSFII
ncbi:hypothetical protein FRX31_016465 [Thalictrum thalictroides]|uniref:Uncharacterized protein n=1 Tax=Thalictrum thalictroides TaxID=46969 RepID=A0A7J6WAP4_THATH|nr:hypothetical protein FRX31_016465 [Thalictrum thalictroides]